MAIRETSAGHDALGLDEDDLRRMHYYMLLARRVDERSWILNRQGKAAFVISCQGQEAAQVGAAYNLLGDDPAPRSDAPRPVPKPPGQEGRPE